MNIKIFHTNDIHSNFDSYKNMASYIYDNKKEIDLYLDSGDYIDLMSPIVQSDMGMSAIEIAFNFKLDVMAIGNNEIDLGKEAIEKIINKYPLICANLLDDKYNEIIGLKKSIIIEKMNIKFLIIGLAPYYNQKGRAGAYNSFFSNGNLLTTNPYVAIEKELEKNKNKYDFCILLSHSGFWMDKFFLEKYNDIDLILGGHSHEIIIKEKYSQSGRGDNLGIIELKYFNNSISISDNYHFKINNYTDTIKFDKIYNEKLNFATKILSKEIQSLDNLEYKAYGECRLINFICDSILNEMGGDLSIMHHGIASQSLNKPISKLTILNSLPSKLFPTKYKILGHNIIDAIKLSYNKEYIHSPSIGAGFRGKIKGFLSFSSNVKIYKDPLEIYINNELINPNKLYTIVTDDYIQRGSAYPSLKVPSTEAQYMKIYIRDVVELYLNNRKIFNKSQVLRRY